MRTSTLRTTTTPRPAMGSALWLVACWAALDGAVASYLQANGVNAISTALLVLAAVSFGIAVAVSGRGASTVQPALLLLVCIQVGFRLAIPYQPGATSAEWLIPSIAIAALALALGAILFARSAAPPARAQACLLGVAILGLGCRVAIVLLDPYPTFDVPRIQEAAGAALRAGTDPYLTNVYAPGYPYLPVAAIAAGLGGLFGDARWAVVMGDAMTILGLLLLARRCRAPALTGPTMAALWAWWGGALYVAWQGFPEPILLGLLTLGVAASVGSPRDRLVAGLLIGGAVATKQFGVAALPYLVRFADGRRVLAVALLTAAAVTVPFALWHTPEFLEGSFWSLLDTPGRDYALNLLVWPSGRVELPYVPLLVLAVGAGWLVARRFDASGPDAAWLAGSTTLLLLAFLGNRIAFVNYYAMAMLFLLLLVTVLVAVGGARASTAHAPAGSR